MKECGGCGKVLPITAYHKRGGSRRGHQAQCKSCRNTDSRKYKSHISSLVKRWKLSKGCALCDFKATHHCQLDIDHIIPKRRNTKCRQAINTGWSKKRLKKELSKCQVLCANCHRLKTYNDGTMFGPSSVSKKTYD